eukprot:CAMPEP_0172805882 /NCGR_PEP_ID=MMETSP1075-20121228/5997_1 /TAXON_ID=2916 /ORGANISM="Ceratium fusus, Strain PA161109" /LENGTH=43 /DNA_ID= /DNA_START= /DNA_END= /DNA_ORIENTATION=
MLYAEPGTGSSITKTAGKVLQSPCADAGAMIVTKRSHNPRLEP